ncbi:hypothetical protein BST81_18930 [Leptolyngbya sp. 'hensonii']|uniref:HEAT repeat domain-containing protein n=1 Tax=Leptolyngbya sp. 'hensonii' TaxID=1922337 RepID=UPI00095034B2|nr:HEAT repeat domain-containing protein [Leptolyngbya sp. 'hensonii']OLP16772.1 hypothetical protein BST81_18930 [Leptolyngbya sp. 'hensonii']
MASLLQFILNLFQGKPQAPKPEAVPSGPPQQNPPAATSGPKTLPPITANNPQSSLEAQIQAWGEAGQNSAIPLITSHARHGSAEVRSAVAIALGQITQGSGLGNGITLTLTVLASLSRDSVPAVRIAAVNTLGRIKSEKVIPLLQQALRDPNPGVVVAASAAIAPFKSYPVKKTVEPKVAPAKRG